MPFKNPPRQITLPDGATTGQVRWVLGADTPPELQAYGIDNALIAYVTHILAPTVEVGYFFIGVSNKMDLGADDMALVFGNVTYPTPGDPSSPTMANVKTNFQQDLWSQFQNTIFKDHAVTLFPGVRLDAKDGNASFECYGTLVSGDSQHRLMIFRDGKHEFGPGNAVRDVDIQRTGVGELTTTGVYRRDDCHSLISSAVSSGAIGAEAIVLTLASTTFRANRAYRFHFGTSFVASVANNTTFNIRRTNLAGALILGSFFFPGIAATHVWAEATNVARNNTGSDITQVMVLTMAASAGTTTMFGGANLVRYLEVNDCGPASKFPNAPGV